jgi:hypothetical protein
MGAEKGPHKKLLVSEIDNLKRQRVLNLNVSLIRILYTTKNGVNVQVHT